MGSTALAIKEDNVPAHVAASMGAGRGNENVGAERTDTSFEALLQKMSRRSRQTPRQVRRKGAEPGLLVYNTLTDQVYSATTLHMLQLHVQAVNTLSGEIVTQAVVYSVELTDLQLQPKKLCRGNRTDLTTMTVSPNTPTHVWCLKNPETGELEAFSCHHGLSPAPSSESPRAWNCSDRYERRRSFRWLCGTMLAVPPRTRWAKHL